MEQEKDTRANQCKQIIEYITQHGIITSAAAMTDLGIYRLASRIHDLKRLGYPIESKWEQTINRYGRAVKYKSYRLGERGDAQ